MTMLDDDALAALFAEAAASFEVPADGATEILARTVGERAGASEPADGLDGAGLDRAGLSDEDSGFGSFALAQARRARRVAGAHRVLTAVACVVLALGVAAGATALSRHGATPPVTAALAQDHGAAKTATGTQGLKQSTPTAGTGGGFSVANGTGTTGTATGSGAASIPASSTGTSAQGASPTASAAAPTTLNGAVQGPRIEQSGSLNLRIAKGTLAKDVSQLSFVASAYGGFVSNSQTQTGQDAISGTPSATVTLQIPVANFETVVKKVQSLGTTEALSTKANNVTSQYVNVQAQIAADQASEQQYLTIMTKASSIGDVLAVQAQLNSIESDIEQLQGQLNVLNSQTTYSSLVTNLSEQGPSHHHTTPPPHHRSGLLSAWDGSVGGFVRGAEDLLRLAGPALFILLCGLVLVLGGRTGWRQYQRRAL